VNDKIDGEAQVRWCKANDNDPDPTIKTRLENSRGKAKYNHEKRAEMDKLIKEHDLKSGRPDELLTPGAAPGTIHIRGPGTAAVGYEPCLRPLSYPMTWLPP
jgi:hypothetical protein